MPFRHPTMFSDSDQRSRWVWLEWTRPVWALVVIPPLLVSPGRFSVPALAWLVTLWFVTGLLSGRWGRRTPVDGPLLVLLLAVGLSVVFSPLPSVTRTHVGTVLAAFVAYVTLSTWATSLTRARIVAWGIAVVTLSLALAAPFMVEWGKRLFLLPEVFAVLPRLPATVNKNVMGGALATQVPLIWGLAFSHRSGERSVLLHRSALLIALLVGGMVILTQSRGAYLALLVGCYLVAALRWPLLWAAIGPAVVGGGWLVAQGRFLPLLERALESDALGGLPGRLEVWSRALYAMTDFGIVGLGLGTYGRIVPVIYPYIIIGPDKPINHAHNLFLHVGAELGVGGLVAFLALVIGWYILGVRAWRGWFSQGRTEEAFLMLGALGSLTVLVVHGLADAVTWGTQPAFLSWATLGLLVGLGTQVGEGQ